MAFTYSYPISASFGASKSGQIGNVGYTVIDSTGTVQIARTTSGITERQDASGSNGTGVYEAIPTLNTAWGNVRLIWNITGLSGVAAEEILTNTGNIVELDLTQAIPTSNTAQTVGDALNAARAQGFGAWTVTGSTFTLYAPDGVTVVKTFTLNSPTSPTSRV